MDINDKTVDNIDIKSMVRDEIDKAMKSVKPQVEISVKSPYEMKFTSMKSVKTCKNFNSDADALYFGHTVLANLGRAESQNFIKAITTYQNGATNADGAYLVPEEMAAGIIRLRNQYGVARRNCRIENMTSDTKLVNTNLINLAATWEGATQAAATTPTKAAFGQASLVAKKLKVLAYITEEVDEDALVSVADQLAQDIAHALAVAEDAACFIGDGSSTYGGITGLIPAMEAVGETNKSIIALATDWDSLSLADLSVVFGYVPQYSTQSGNAKWFMSQTMWGVVSGLMISVGGMTFTEVAGGKPQAQLHGYPIEIVHAMPSVYADDEIGILFGDLSTAVLMGDRRGITIKSSDSTDAGFSQDLIAIKGTERVDFKVYNPGSTTVPGGMIGIAFNGSGDYSL